MQDIVTEITKQGSLLTGNLNDITQDMRSTLDKLKLTPIINDLLRRHIGDDGIS